MVVARLPTGLQVICSNASSKYPQGSGGFVTKLWPRLRASPTEPALCESNHLQLAPLSPNKPQFCPQKLRCIFKRKAPLELNSENFVQDRPRRHTSWPLSWHEDAGCASGSVMGRPGLMWPGGAPTPLCVSFPILSIPLSTPSVCGMRECGSKKKRRHFDCSC